LALTLSRFLTVQAATCQETKKDVACMDNGRFIGNSININEMY